MSDTLYLQLDQNIEVTNPHVYLQDIAALSMADAKKLNRLRVMQVMVLDPMKPGRYVMSVSDLPQARYFAMLKFSLYAWFLFLGQPSLL